MTRPPHDSCQLVAALRGDGHCHQLHDGYPPLALATTWGELTEERDLRELLRARWLGHLGIEDASSDTTAALAAAVDSVEAGLTPLLDAASVTGTLPVTDPDRIAIGYGHDGPWVAATGWLPGPVETTVLPTRSALREVTGPLVTAWSTTAGVPHARLVRLIDDTIHVSSNRG